MVPNSRKNEDKELASGKGKILQFSRSKYRQGCLDLLNGKETTVSC